mmetsp:Transcript_3063/g.5881  ORF Transcript_3063/g.5881 Transcript_3063/m.5881 type:complete len:203 (-) Transcript_3063:488-1096(-)
MESIRSGLRGHKSTHSSCPRYGEGEAFCACYLSWDRKPSSLSRRDLESILGYPCMEEACGGHFGAERTAFHSGPPWWDGTTQRRLQGDAQYHSLFGKFPWWRSCLASTSRRSRCGSLNQPRCVCRESRRSHCHSRCSEKAHCRHVPSLTLQTVTPIKVRMSLSQRKSREDLKLRENTQQQGRTEQTTTPHLQCAPSPPPSPC